MYGRALSSAKMMRSNRLRRRSGENVSSACVMIDIDEIALNIRRVKYVREMKR